MADEGRERLAAIVLGAEDGAAQAAPLPVDMLGRGIDRDIRAEFERLLQKRRREHIVDHHRRTGAVRQAGDRPHIDDFELRVGRRLQENRLCRARQHPLPGRKVRAVDQFGDDAEARQDIGADKGAGAEQRARRHQPVAGAQQADQGGEDGRHAARRRDAGLGAFDRAQPVDEHLHRRVAVAAVDVAQVRVVEGVRRFLGRAVDIARGEIERLGGLLEAAAHDAAVHGGGLRVKRIGKVPDTGPGRLDRSIHGHPHGLPVGGPTEIGSVAL